MLTETASYGEVVVTIIAVIALIYDLIAIVDAIKDLRKKDLSVTLKYLAWITLYIDSMIGFGLVIFGVAGGYYMGIPQPVHVGDQFIVDFLGIGIICFEILLLGAAYLQVWIRRRVKQGEQPWDQKTERRSK